MIVPNITCHISQYISLESFSSVFFFFLNLGVQSFYRNVNNQNSVFLYDKLAKNVLVHILTITEITAWR